MAEPGVVECAECGHDIIGMHTARGCQFEECPCAIGWTMVAKRAYVREWGYDYD
jgi:ribosomal protein L34E